jgi:hypothetical protein
VRARLTKCVQRSISMVSFVSFVLSVLLLFSSSFFTVLTVHDSLVEISIFFLLNL